MSRTVQDMDIGLFACGGENSLLKGQFARILNFDQNTGENAGFIKKVVFSIFRPMNHPMSHNMGLKLHDISP